MNLSTEERQLIRQTWSAATTDFNATGVELFLRFFRENPGDQRHFSFRDVANLETLRNDARLKAHVRNVMHTMRMVIESLDEPDVAEQMVTKIAASHSRRSLRAEHFERFKITLIGLLADSLGPPVWTDSARAAWSKMFDLFVAAIRKLGDNDNNK